MNRGASVVTRTTLKIQQLNCFTNTKVERVNEYLRAIALGNIVSPFLKDPTVCPFGFGKRLQDNSIQAIENKIMNTGKIHKTLDQQ